jgi:hypothetical protein
MLNLENYYFLIEFFQSFHIHTEKDQILFLESILQQLHAKRVPVHPFAQSHFQAGIIKSGSAKAHSISAGFAVERRKCQITLSISGPKPWRLKNH